MSEELIAAGMEVVKEKLTPEINLPPSSIYDLAKSMIEEDKLGDDKWLAHNIKMSMQHIRTKRGTAKSQGYFPFANMGLKAYKDIQEKYDPWILPLMAEKLENAEDIFAMWAIQCAAAMQSLGEKQCSMSQNLYEFVTKSEAWKTARQAAEQFARINKPKAQKPKSKPSAAQKPSLQSQPLQPAPAGDAVPAKMEITLKINELPNAGVTERQVRFFLLSTGEKKISVSVKSKIFNKLIEADKQYPEWVAAISGQMGNVSGNTIELEKANIQVFERKPKAQKMPEKSTQN